MLMIFDLTIYKKYICYLTGSHKNMTSYSTTSKSDAKRIVWVDLEMTGLDIDKHHILEIACLVTDANLNIIAKGPNIIIHQSDEILSNMNEWCIAQHGEVYMKKL